MFEEFFTEEHNSLLVSKEKMDELLLEYNSSEYGYTQFSFLNDHKSLRKGKKHLILGTTGTGKSTLARSLVAQLAKGSKVFWYSSEESYDDMIIMLSLLGVENDIKENIIFKNEVSVVESLKSNQIGFTEYISKEIVNNACDIFVYDNITTSSFYNGNFESAIKFFDQVSSMVKKLNIPLILIAHTAAGVKDLQSELFTPDHIKGPKMVSNRCEFIYGYQLITYTEKVSSEEKKQGFIRLLKSRSHGVSGSVYSLNFDNKTMSYKNDSKVTFETFKKFYDLRIKLK